MIYVAYDWPKECLSLGGWLFHSWSFRNRHDHYERGIRLFGFVISNWCEEGE